MFTVQIKEMTSHFSHVMKRAVVIRQFSKEKVINEPNLHQELIKELHIKIKRENDAHETVKNVFMGIIGIGLLCFVVDTSVEICNDVSKSVKERWKED